MAQAGGGSHQTALSGALRMAGVTSAEAMQRALQADWAAAAAEAGLPAGTAAAAAAKAQAMTAMQQQSAATHASTMEAQMVRLVELS